MTALRTQQKKNPHSDVPVSDSPAQDGLGPVVTAIGMVMALWCLGFAMVNLVFEITGHFAGGAYAHYASGISVMDWLVAGLKVLGAAVALLSVARRPRHVSSAVVTVLGGQHSPRSPCMCWAAWLRRPAWDWD